MPSGVAISYEGRLASEKKSGLHAETMTRSKSCHHFMPSGRKGSYATW